MTSDATILNSKLRKAFDQIRLLPRALALIWKASRGWTAIWTALLIVQGILPVASVYLTRGVVDSLVVAVRTQGDPQQIRHTFVLLAVVALVLLLGEALRSLATWVRAAQSDLVQDYITALIHDKSVAADMAFYESADFYDHLHRARSESGYRPIVLLETLGRLLQNGITLAAMSAVLLPYGFWLPVTLVLSTLPVLYVVLRYALKQNQWLLKITSTERRTWYYDWLLTAGETASELRLFGLGCYFQSRYQSLRNQVRSERLALVKKQSVAEILAGVSALLVSGTAMAWMVWKAMKGLISLGELALFYQAYQQGLRLMHSLLEDVGHLYQNTLFLGNLFEFLALKAIVISPQAAEGVPARVREGIRFHAVTFYYPGADRPALDHFEMSIPAGQIAAIVGPNGAGKSTLLKLLCRFYDPQEGRIELDGIDVRAINLESLRSSITVLFQKPVEYNATAAENIALGDQPSQPGEAALKLAAEAAGIDETIRKLPQGYDTLLGKWFAGGTQLSVGEWQRVALARAFLRQSPVLILDEPTSSMDPWAEAEWLRRFRTLAAGRTAILITHRLTTAMLADQVYVVQDGRVVETGTHEVLSSKGGPYSQWCAIHGPE